MNAFMRIKSMKYAMFIRTYCFLLSIFILFAVVEGGFILTSSKVIDSDSIVNFTITVFDAPEGENLSVRLISDSEIIAESNVSVQNDGIMPFQMDIPPVSSDITARLHVLANFSNGYIMDQWKDVRIRRNTVLSLVQTDKPLYKPGEIIRFRVLTMDNQLRSLTEVPVVDIWIKDPSGILVERWKEVQFTEAIKQFEFPLSEEPTLGTWKIITEINGMSTNKTFKVEKYVLPKFEVIVDAPSEVLADIENITIEVCAKYTYGKVVKGTMSARIEYSPQRESYHVPSVEYLEEISGCHRFVLYMEKLNLPRYELKEYDRIAESLKILTNVTETGTGIMRNATTQIAITHYPLFIHFVGNNEYFKRSLPYYGQLQVTRPDGSPVDAERIKTCAKFESVGLAVEECVTSISDISGIVHFSIAPSSAGKIHLKASGIDQISTNNSETLSEKPQLLIPVGEIEIKPWFSPSDSYLQIVTTSEELACDKLQQVKVLYNAKNGTRARFYYQIQSKGRLVQQGSLEHMFESKIDNETEYDFSDNLPVREEDVGEFVLRFETTISMSPKIRLLVYYVREDKEVVADSKTFRITQCFQNKVRLQFHQEEQHPGTEATMLLSASPYSLCGINMLDKSIKLLERKEKGFSAQKHISELLEAEDVGKFEEPRMKETCYRNIHAYYPRPDNLTSYIEKRENIYRGYRYADAVMAFEEAGTVFISDLFVKTTPCILTGRKGGRRKTKSRGRSSYKGGGVTAVKVHSSAETDYKEIKKPDKTETPKLADEVRSYFPETWLWEIHTIDSTGEKTIERQLPHTITEWTGGAICLHPETGLGISQDSNITTFQPFFIDFQLPYSVIRGEALPLIVTVFNYLPQCLQVKLSLEPSENFKILSEFRFAKICVCGEQSESSKFLIRPVTLGKVNITVHAYSKEDHKETCGNEVTASLNARDAVTKELLVEVEGFPKEEVLNYFICPESKRKYFMCLGNPKGSYAADLYLLLPDDVVSESGRAFMSVTGDIMGSALNGLENLVKLPTGCGEQNMILFAPNIFVLDYLKATGKITKAIEAKCTNYMKIGYQRELQYRHEDGSYSAFGTDDKEGSLWLTAFVVRSFGQAKRFITVDKKDLNRSVTWILNMQNENGCFRPSGMVHHREMKGGLEGGRESLAPLTAFVLISLLESATELSNEDVVRKGLTCLKSEKLPDNYALALFAYACALAKDFPMSRKYIKKLNKQAVIVENQKYWHSSSLSKSVSVEISSYYILTQMKIEKSGGIIKSLPVVRWMSEQRNSNGGFVSTQDTLMALQALAKYASYQSHSNVDIGLTIRSDGLVHSFDVNEDNKLVTQSVKIPILPAILHLEATGNGCAFVQFTVRYNVANISDNLAFDLNVDTNPSEDSDFNLTNLNICMRYNIINETSNMAILLAKMPSGFLPDESSLLELQNDPYVQLKRYEMKGNDVNLYFDELTNDQKCFNFKMMNEFEVEDVKPSIVRLYDYYQPENAVFVEYSVLNSASETSSPELSSLLLKNTEQLDNEETSTEDMKFILDVTTEGTV